MTDLTEMKPCPFCGGTPSIESIEPHKHYIIVFPDYPGSTSIECCMCEFRIVGEYGTDEAINKWNKRA